MSTAIWNETEIEVDQYDTDGRMRIRDRADQIVCDERDFDATRCDFALLPHFGYTSAVRSTESGLHHFGARWYSAQAGQFLAPDYRFRHR